MKYKKGQRVFIYNYLRNDAPNRCLVPATIMSEERVDEFYSVVTDSGVHKLRTESEIYLEGGTPDVPVAR